MKTLLLIDLQNDFMPFGALPVPSGDEVVPIANSLASAFDLVVAAMDWHPRGHASFASSHPGTQPGDVVDIDGLPQVLWPDHCVQETPGASFHSALDVSRIGHVIHKGDDPRVDSYSAFFDNDHVRDTGLTSYLREARAETLWVMGVATDYCVLASALDARQMGFEVIVLADGCRAVDLAAADGERAFARMREAGCRVATSADVHS